MTINLTPPQLWAMAGFIGIVLGSFMPWAQVGIFTANGTDGDGVITLILGGAGFLLMLASTRGPAIIALLLALGAGGIGLYDASNISSAISDLDGNPFAANASVGTGLYLLIAASVVAAGASFARQAELASTRSPASTAPSPAADEEWQ